MTRSVVAYTSAVLLPLAVIVIVQWLRLPPFVFEHLMVLLVVACAVPWGVGPALVAAIVAVAGDNVLLREPYWQPAISGVRDIMDLVLFVIVAVTVAWLVATARTQRRLAEDAAERERRAREEHDRLIATISHDLAAPLTAIRGTVQFAHRFGNEAPLDIKRLLCRLDTAASRATSLVGTLRDTQAMERGELSITKEPADLRDVVIPVVEMFDRISERHPVVVNVPDEPIIVNADPARLQRVVENLLANAIKYSPSGGTVEVSLAADTRCATVTVRDYGIGIREESRPFIFQPAYRAPEATATAPGLGLGLSIAAEIAARHGGSIDARPAPQQGSIFTLRLPLKRDIAPTTSTAAAAAAPKRVR